jgi:hypothetical protein
LSYSVTILDRRTGQTVTGNMDGDWRDASGYDLSYLWDEGNYGCDCNRFLFSERWLGREPEFDDAKCIWDDFPDGKRYRVLKIMVGGEEVYAETPTP